MRPRTTTGGIPRAGRGASWWDGVTERVHLRRRASDRAEERANRAAKLGDLIGLWVASGQADVAHRRRAEWQERQETLPEPSPTDAAPESDTTATADV